MKRRLLLLDLLLLVLVLLAGMLLKQRWEQAHAREMALLQQRIRPIPAPALAPLVPVSPVQGGMYVEVAQNMLVLERSQSEYHRRSAAASSSFSPVPALPWAHGVIQFGDKPTVILSEMPGGAEKSYQPGDDIGPFKVLDVNTTHILLEWKGLRILKTIEEITDHTAPREKTTAARSSLRRPCCRAYGDKAQRGSDRHRPGQQHKGLLPD